MLKPSCAASVHVKTALRTGCPLPASLLDAHTHVPSFSARPRLSLWCAALPQLASMLL